MEETMEEQTNTQPNIGPFTRLLDIPGVNGPEDIFGNLGGSGGENPFGDGEGGASTDMDMSELPYNGNPFAGDNFWDIFAGGVNPTESSFGGGSNPFAGGDGGFGGGSNPFAGGEGGGISFGGGSNPFSGGGMSFGGGSFGGR
ncbi:MAG: hypothetical protein VKN72_29900 [Nostocales cyanobacterium 94392]|nr:hypothetical protein [Nostocales cyanobacterium 94392]